MAWQKLETNTLSGASDDLDLGATTALSAKKFLEHLVHKITSGNANANCTYNNDSGSNYARRVSGNGAADTTLVSQTSFGVSFSGDGNDEFIILDIINISAQEKLVIGHMINRNTVGAANAPNRVEIIAKWANTSAQITRIDLNNTDTGDYTTDSNATALGTD